MSMKKRAEKETTVAVFCALLLGAIAFLSDVPKAEAEDPPSLLPEGVLYEHVGTERRTAFFVHGDGGPDIYLNSQRFPNTDGSSNSVVELSVGGAIGGRCDPEQYNCLRIAFEQAYWEPTAGEFLAEYHPVETCFQDPDGVRCTRPITGFCRHNQLESGHIQEGSHECRTFLNSGVSFGNYGQGGDGSLKHGVHILPDHVYNNGAEDLQSWNIHLTHRSQISVHEPQQPIIVDPSGQIFGTSNGYLVVGNQTNSTRIGGDLLIDGYFEPNRQSSPTCPTPPVNKMVMWHDTSPGSTRGPTLVYTSPLKGRVGIELKPILE